MNGLSRVTAAACGLALAGCASAPMSFVDALPTARTDTSLYPVRVRYSGFAFAFNTGGLIGGAVIPILAQRISNGGGLAYAGLLLSLAGLLTFAAVMVSHFLQQGLGSERAIPAT